MRRRQLIALLGAATLGLPLAAAAQPAGRVRRIGFLYFGSRQAALDTGRYDNFLKGMGEHGLVEGKNLAIEARFADSNRERAAQLAAELVRLNPEVIVATGSPTYRALRNVTTTIPVVVTVTVDPVREGLAASLARPGGNFTGLTDTAALLSPKHLELLGEVVPNLSRVAALINPDNTSHAAQVTNLMAEAQKLGKRVHLVQARTTGEIESGLAEAGKAGVQALTFFGDTFFAEQLGVIAGHAIRHRMAAAQSLRPFAEAGGLLSYGADLTDNFRRASVFVDKILRGAKAAELPFEQPTRYYLTVNLKTAKALGLSVPKSLLARADRVIE